MARERRRLLVMPERLAAGAGAVAVEPEEAHYLRRVLRLRAGDPLAVVDGRGRLWTAQLGADGLLRLDQPLAAPLQQQAPPLPPLALAVALPRLDADVLLRMACELGIDRLVPLRAERSVAAERLRPQRRQAILREAVEQCERLWLPELAAEQGAAAWLERHGAAEATGVKLLATTRRQGLPALEAVLAGLPPAAHPDGSAAVTAAVTVAVGPEGGWSPAEEAAAAAAGWLPVSLGDTILRSSTAAVAAATLLVSWRRAAGTAPGVSCGTSQPPSP